MGNNCNRITLVISSLGAGGAERVAAELANGFAKKGFIVTVITLDDKKTDFYSLSPTIHRIRLSENSNRNISKLKKNKFLRNSNYLFKLRNEILNSNPTVIISFMPQTNMKVLIGMIGVKIPIIVTEHSDPQRLKKAPYWYLLRYFVYPISNKVVSVSKGINDYFWWIKQNKRLVIHNPLTNIDVPSEVDVNFYFKYPKTIISMGRLDFNKGFDILIKSYIDIAHKFPDWQLLILGEGKERENLERLIRNSNLDNRIFLPGRVRNPFQFLKKADIFALTSRNEGFGNVLIEAMACHLPVIAIESIGPSEIIRHDYNGFLAKREEEFTEKLTVLMIDPKKRKELIMNSSKELCKYEINNILDEWIKLIKKIILKGAS